MRNEKQDLSKLPTADLPKTIAEEKERLAKMQFAHAITPLQNAMTIREQRRHIARLQTEKTARLKNQA